jgi:hypothetical protein
MHYIKSNVAEAQPVNVPYLVDVTEQLEPHVLCRLYSWYTVLFSSPNPFRYKLFLKHDLAVEYLMEAKRSIARYKHLSDAQVHALYDVCGGVPWYVMARNEDGMAFMEGALVNQGTGVAPQPHLSRVSTAIHDDDFYMLVHLYRTEPDPLKKQRYRYEPASGFVLGELRKINEAAVSERYSQTPLLGSQRARAIL